MLDKFYENFKIRDYMNLEDDIESDDKIIDCALGTNPFIDENILDNCIKVDNLLLNKYQSDDYNILARKIVDFYNRNLNKNLTIENIAFGSRKYGGNKKFK